MKRREPNRTNPRMSIYDRYSMGRRKDAASVSMARQLAANEELVKKLGGIYDPDKDYYWDQKSAKGHRLRDGIERLLRAIQNGDYDGVVVYEWERFMRNRVQ